MESERIKALRKAMDCTLERFARKVGSSYTTVCHWESGRFQPSIRYIKILEELCKEHGV